MARREATFGGDLAASLSAWRTAPALPLLTLAVAAIADVADVVGRAGSVIALPALLFLGWAWLAWASRRGAPWRVPSIPDSRWVPIAWLVAVVVFGVARNLPGSSLAP